MLGAATAAKNAYSAARYAAYALPLLYGAARNFSAGSRMGRVGQRPVARVRNGFPYKRPAGGSATKMRRRVGSKLRRKVPGPVVTRRKRKRTALQASAYHCKYFKRTHGKKHSRAYVRNRLVDTSVTQLRLRHSYMSDWSADDPATGAMSGVSFLRFAGLRDGNANLTTMPVKMFNLSSTAQGSNISSPFWELVYNNTGSSYCWFNGYGLSNTAVATQPWIVEDNAGIAAATPHLRRKALMRWSRCRLQFYGKTKQPTKITVQIVKFLDEEFCPEYYTLTSGYTANVTNKAKEMLDRICKPLVNNPIASQLATSKPTLKVLKEYVIEIDPTRSTDNDQDVHRRVLDIFNRWDRVVNLTAPNSNVAANTLANLDDANKYVGPSSGYGVVPNKINDSVYLVIKSMQARKVDDSGAGVVQSTVAETASMDWNIQTCWADVGDA